jgi:hypothetical protein
MGNAIDLPDEQVEVFSRAMFLAALASKGVDLEDLAARGVKFMNSVDEKISFQAWKTIVTECIGNKAVGNADGDQRLYRMVKHLQEQVRGKRQIS